MRQVLVGRQPVFDRDYQVCAYELLFRPHGGMEFSDDGASLTANVLISALMDIGLDKVTGNHIAFVNADSEFLLSDTPVSELLPADRVAIEVLESVPATPETEAAVKALKSQGYTVLLDDVVKAADVESFMDHADIVKLDIQATENLGDEVRALRRHKVKLLAEKVETYEQYEQCKALNFDLYQGYFFCKPDIVEGKKLPESKLAILRALQKVLTAEALDEIHEVVKQDVGLSYRLLKYINSAAFGLRREVESIEQAMSLLGLNKLRRWLSLLSLAALGDNKPAELVRTALYRGQFLEALAGLLGEAETGDDFLLGMFSVLDALLDQPMDKALDDLSLPGEVRNTLLDASASMGHKLSLVKALDAGDWDTVTAWCQKYPRVEVTDLTRVQVEAMGWADEQMTALAAG
ncbi:MAG: HDOD domain-containing protein [Mariprofundaceae bacterium]